MSVKLQQYTLHYDGSITIDPSSLFKFVGKVKPHKLFLTESTPDVTMYNKTVPTELKIRVRTSDPISLPPSTWILDSQSRMSDMELFTHLCTRLKSVVEHQTSDYKLSAVKRLQQEWELYKKHNMLDLLRALLTTINTLTQKNVAWGPGRGSSTSSYILYIIGLHDVDCVLYDIDVTDFIKG